ncbi:exodeoxyribonuclease VII large subunit [Pseudohaliea rubra]|uniref:Exodeoxyribonuclease 7 large subunit n=1 Tax=Pseudohaliea rubra DSM 19751 TaxID=1265313 RepID=A0A095VVG4_9GAMM|nr:exodeoxyribonuclease VII large subunit [Pseudohaliea rubra]KGE05023.1 Exodeoxyribonuclease VII large subunit [Pseudohaliea rubra DSM 19751]
MQTTASSPPAVSVSRLAREVKTLLESHFDFVWVEGEISNLARPASGHWYFSLKDDGAQVRCAMFRRANQRLRFTPENGDAVRLRARVSLYEARGDFQLIVEYLEPAGAGALQARFEALRAKLEAEGLFAAERKLPLPAAPAHLGIITSATGAALQDMLTVLRRRCPLIRVSLLPVPVQGVEAAPALCAAIARANRWQESGAACFDALIVGRGGGSLEDLWAFNEESVARAIADSALPVVSAVGHETDITIADLVADQRAPTPSAAAELLSPDQADWRLRLAQLDEALTRSMARQLRDAGRELAHLRARLKHPGTLLRERAQRLDDLEGRLARAQASAFQREHRRLDRLTERLLRRDPRPRLARLGDRLDDAEHRLRQAMSHGLVRRQERLSRLAALLDSLSPLATLGRGYAILTDESGAILRRARDTSVGDAVGARLAEGRLALRVEGVERVEEDDR